MNLKNKNILIISPESWGLNYVSKHHYATELAKKRNTVYFLNPPSYQKMIRKESEYLYIVDYKKKYRGLSKIPSFVSAYLIKKELYKIERFCKLKFDVIWNFDSSRFFNLKLIPEKLKISHIVDLSEGNNSKLLSKTADICFASTEYILQRQKKNNPNSFNIGHGFSNYTISNNLNLKSETKLKVGYLGNLLISYLDWNLIHSIVVAYPNIMFYFGGPFLASNLSLSSKKPEFLIKTMEEKNSIFLGHIPQDKINSFLSQMDILWLVYKSDQYKEQLANPHKILEYLASGNVTITTWTDEYKDKSELLEMTDSPDRFKLKFKEVVSSYKTLNSSKSKILRKTFALENTYDKKIDLIDKILNKYKKEH